MEYQAVTQAREFSEKMYKGSGERYATYIRKSIEKRIARGSITEQEAHELRLGDLLAGNDGI